MPIKRKWIVTNLPSLSRVMRRLFRLRRKKKGKKERPVFWSVTVSDPKRPKAAPFRLTIEVLDLMAATEVGKNVPFQLIMFKGQVANCPQLTKSKELGAYVEVSFKMGAKEGSLQIESIG
jgi:hypothetical protein